MKIQFLLIIIMMSIRSNPQSGNIDALIPPQGFDIRLLNSAGTSSINNDVSNIGFMNPASISNFDNLSIGLSYQFNSDIDKGWINDSKVKRQYNLIPQSAGSTIKWKHLTFGLGFAQNYNSRVDFVWNPNSFEDPEITEFRGRVSSFSAIAAYTVEEVFNGSSLSLGFSYTLNSVDFASKNNESEISLSDNAGNYSFGILYSVKNISGRKTALGFSFTTNTKFESEYFYSSFPVIIRHDSESSLAVAQNLVEGNIPAQFNFDISTDLTEKLLLNGSLTGLFWNTNNTQLKDQLEVSASMVFKLNENFSPAAGFYYTDKKYDPDIFDFNNKFNAVFLIAGLKLNFNMFNADLTIADSHLLSGEFRKQTIGKISLGIKL